MLNSSSLSTLTHIFYSLSLSACIYNRIVIRILLHIYHNIIKVKVIGITQVFAQISLVIMLNNFWDIWITNEKENNIVHIPIRTTQVGVFGTDDHTETIIMASESIQAIRYRTLQRQHHSFIRALSCTNKSVLITGSAHCNVKIKEEIAIDFSCIDNNRPRQNSFGVYRMATSVRNVWF